MLIQIDWKEYTATINSFLTSLLRTKEQEQDILYEAARYAVLGDGKRIRPLLCVLVANMFSVPLEQSLQPAAAIEFIHCYSLIHDDLPAMDNDDFRRGKPTVHRAFPESIAILAGDYLLTYAFELLSTAPHLTDNVKIQLVKLLAESSGGEGMVGGQVRDMNSTNSLLTLNELQGLHHRKTGKLINAAILFGAILGRVDKGTYQTLDRIGHQLGLIFQIADDIIDVTQSEAKHGKQESSDVANNKVTYVSLLGIQGARDEIRNIQHSIKEDFRTLPCRSDELSSVLDWITSRCL